MDDDAINLAAEAAADANASPAAAADPFRPPAEPCECFCMHCERVVDSAGMWFQPVVNGPPGSDGFWMCPTANCSGAGFGFDLHPTDPDHPANAGWHRGSDEAWDEDDPDGEDSTAEYDPDEPQYADDLAGPDDDIEGEEWKHGLQPGEALPERPEVAAARAAWEAQQQKYDEPDRRPRTVDGSHWKRREPPTFDGEVGDDDIPF